MTGEEEESGFEPQSAHAIDEESRNDASSAIESVHKSLHSILTDYDDERMDPSSINGFSFLGLAVIRDDCLMVMMVDDEAMRRV
jgi:hypothetical protein